MKNSWIIRKFLLVQPRPDVIRLSNGSDSVPTEMRPAKSKSFSKLADSIYAIQPDLIELLDKDGTVIRAMRPNEEISRSDAAEAPKVLSEDPETARLTHFANLIHRAYEHSTEIAFVKLVELVERIDARSDAIEARLERAESAHRRALQDQIDDAFDRAEEVAEGGEGQFRDQMMANFLEGAMQRPERSRTRRRSGSGGASTGTGKVTTQ